MRVSDIFTTGTRVTGRDDDHGHSWGDRDRDDRGRHTRGHWDRWHRWCWDD